MKVSFKQFILFCANVEKLVSFYKDCFGFTIIGDTDKNWTVLDAGQLQIAFHKIGEQYLTTSAEEFKITDSNVKLVFETDGDLTILRQSLLSKMVAIGEIQQFPGYPYLSCDGKDPEGNVFQLLQKIE